MAHLTKVSKEIVPDWHDNEVLTKGDTRARLGKRHNMIDKCFVTCDHPKLTGTNSSNSQGPSLAPRTQNKPQMKALCIARLSLKFLAVQATSIPTFVFDIFFEILINKQMNSAPLN